MNNGRLNDEPPNDRLPNRLLSIPTTESLLEGMERLRGGMSAAVASQKLVLKCLGCSKHVIAADEQFLVVYGNITIGLEGGLIGNNFTADWRLANFTVFCFDCIEEKFLEYLRDSVECAKEGPLHETDSDLH